MLFRSGLGARSLGGILPALARSKYCKLAALVSGDISKARHVSRDWDLDSSHVYDYRSFDAIACDDTVDIVYIALPNRLHCEFTQRAAEAGKHVFCERPMATTVSECNAMMDACDRREVQLGVGYQRGIYSIPPSRLANHGSGPVESIRSIHAGWGVSVGDVANWHVRSELSGGGALMHAGVELIRAIRTLIGQEPIAVMAQETKTDATRFADVDESVTWSLQFDSGAQATGAVSLNRAGLNAIRVETDRRSIDIRNPFGDSNPGSSTACTPIESFAESIATGCATPYTAAQGLNDLLLVEAIYRSIREGVPVDLI